MSDLDSMVIKRDVKEFLSKNKRRCEIITSLQDQLNNLNNDSYLDTIEFIEKNKDVFFKDRKSTILFIYTFLDSSINNFRNFEHVLNIPIHFSKEIKSNLTESEIFGLCRIFLNSINYFFLKGFFSITTIINKSIQNTYIFINFLPEIEEYDKEYSELRKKQVLSSLNLNENEKLKNFYETVISDYSNHILNRNLNYHPSPLHKSIRDDDIEAFQQLVSKNNYDLNSPIQHSFYERTKTIDLELEPIKISALYGSLKIFKFLMMNNVNFDQNLLCYAYFGANIEIIHLIENKCSHDEVCIQPIITHNNELFEYFIENFGDEIVEKDEQIKKISCNCDENSFEMLDSECLHCAVISYNYPIIMSCLEKIIYISRYFEIIEEVTNWRENHFLFNSEFDFELFEFIYLHKKPSVNIFQCGSLIDYILKSEDVNSNEVFKFLFFELKDRINCRLLLLNCIKRNHNMANFVLDFLISEKNSNNSRTYFNLSKLQVKFDDLICAINNYNEDIVVKIIQLYNLIKSTNISTFVIELTKYISSKMIYSLFQRILMLFDKEILMCLLKLFDGENYSMIKKLIEDELKNQ